MKVKGWKQTNLAKVGTVVNGGTPSTDNELYWGGTILWCTPTDITKLNGFKYINQTARKITSDGLKNSSAKLIPRGSLILCSRATIGECAISSVELATNQGFKSIVPGNDCEVEYLYYLVKSLKSDLVSISNGSTFLEFTKADMNLIQFPLPPLPEQRKIAEILSTVDEQIQTTRDIIEQTQLLKKGLMQKLFSEGIGHTKFKTTKIGRIPESWEVVKLRSASSRIGDGLHGTPSYVDDIRFPFINGNNLLDGSIVITSRTKYVSERDYKENLKGLGASSLLLSINGTIGSLALYQGEEVMLGKSACYINLKAESNRLFIYYQLLSDRIRRYFENEVTGTTIRNLSLASVRNTPVLCPPLPEQRQIAEILSTVDEQIQVNSDGLEQLQQQKKGLMQQLLTGKIRVRL